MYGGWGWPCGDCGCEGGGVGGGGGWECNKLVEETAFSGMCEKLFLILLVLGSKAMDGEECTDEFGVERVDDDVGDDDEDAVGGDEDDKLG